MKSDFTRLTKNPRTGEFEEAEWLDNYFGRHRFGVRFPSNGEVFDQRAHEWEFKNEEQKP